MKLKLDENVHTDVAPALRALGHDVATLYDQGLAGHPDADVARAVRTEKRALITFELDFADPRLCPPAQFAGLVPAARRCLPSGLLRCAPAPLQRFDR